MAAPPCPEWDFADDGAFDRVNHMGRIGENADVLGNRARAIAEDDDIAARRRGAIDFAEMTACSGEHGLDTRRFGPVTRVGRNGFGIGAVQRAPHAANEAEAVSANTQQARLVMVGRAEPAPGLGDDVVA